jgi:hypothetical protein
MAQNKLLNFEPAYLATASLSTLGANILNCAITSAGTAIVASSIGFTPTQPYVIAKHIRVMNQLSTSAATCALYKGATLASAAGTEFAFPAGTSIPANSYLDWYGQHRFDSGDYLTGFSNLPQSIIINIDGEIGLS